MAELDLSLSDALTDSVPPSGPEGTVERDFVAQLEAEIFEDQVGETVGKTDYIPLLDDDGSTADGGAALENGEQEAHGAQKAGFSTKGSSIFNLQAEAAVQAETPHNSAEPQQATPPAGSEDIKEHSPMKAEPQSPCGPLEVSAGAARFLPTDPPVPPGVSLVSSPRSGLLADWERAAPAGGEEREVEGLDRKQKKKKKRRQKDECNEHLESRGKPEMQVWEENASPTEDCYNRLRAQQGGAEGSWEEPLGKSGGRTKRVKSRKKPPEEFFSSSPAEEAMMDLGSPPIGPEASSGHSKSSQGCEEDLISSHLLLPADSSMIPLVLNSELKATAAPFTMPSSHALGSFTHHDSFDHLLSFDNSTPLSSRPPPVSPDVGATAGGTVDSGMFDLTRSPLESLEPLESCVQVGPDSDTSAFSSASKSSPGPSPYGEVVASAPPFSLSDASWLLNDGQISNSNLFDDTEGSFPGNHLPSTLTLDTESPKPLRSPKTPAQPFPPKEQMEANGVKRSPPPEPEVSPQTSPALGSGLNPAAKPFFPCFADPVKEGTSDRTETQREQLLPLVEQFDPLLEQKTMKVENVSRKPPTTRDAEKLEEPITEEPKTDTHERERNQPERKEGPQKEQQEDTVLHEQTSGTSEEKKVHLGAGVETEVKNAEYFESDEIKVREQKENKSLDTRGLKDDKEKLEIETSQDQKKQQTSSSSLEKDEVLLKKPVETQDHEKTDPKNAEQEKTDPKNEKTDTKNAEQEKTEPKNAEQEKTDPKNEKTDPKNEKTDTKNAEQEKTDPKNAEHEKTDPKNEKINTKNEKTDPKNAEQEKDVVKGLQTAAEEKKMKTERKQDKVQPEKKSLEKKLDQVVNTDVEEKAKTSKLATTADVKKTTTKPLIGVTRRAGKPVPGVPAASARRPLSSSTVSTADRKPSTVKAASTTAAATGAQRNTPRPPSSTTAPRDPKAKSVPERGPLLSKAATASPTASTAATKPAAALPSKTSTAARPASARPTPAPGVRAPMASKTISRPAEEKKTPSVTSTKPKTSTAPPKSRAPPLKPASASSSSGAAPTNKPTAPSTTRPPSSTTTTNVSARPGTAPPSARSKITSSDITRQEPIGAKVQIVSKRTDISQVLSRLGVKDNMKRVPGGEAVQTVKKKVEVKGVSKCGSKDNTRPPPGGANAKVGSHKGKAPPKDNAVVSGGPSTAAQAEGSSETPQQCETAPPLATPLATPLSHDPLPGQASCTNDAIPLDSYIPESSL